MTRQVDQKVLWLGSALIMAAVLMTILNFAPGCQQKKTTVINEGEPAPASCGEDEDGTVRERQCAEPEIGKILDLCKDGDWREVSNTCTAAPDPGDDCDGETLFADVQPILTEKCLGCHFTPQKYDDYGVAKQNINAYLDRINLPVDNPERMPRDPQPPLSPEDRNLLKKWKDDGLKEKCGDGGGQPDFGFYQLDDIETVILNDLSGLDEDDRLNSRYLITSHKANLGGQAEADLGIFREAIDKNLNALNVVNEDVFKTQAVEKTLYRLDLRAYGLNADDWKLVEDTDPFDLESFTDKGETLKFLSGARKPWLHFDTFGEVVGQAPVYYSITDIPLNLDDFLAQVGVNLAAQQENFEAFFLGGFGSPISIQKNRLIVRLTGNDDFPYTWITFDPIDLDNVPERNLFEFPLLADSGGTGDRVFDFAASETITLGPGGLVFALWDNNGIRQDFAPQFIVEDVESPLNSQIDVPIDCNRCHSAGIIPMDDAIRGHVTANASEFDAADVEIILELYKRPGSNVAAFQSDNAEYKEIADKLDFGLGTDAITYANDRLKLEWDIREVASHLLLTETEFRNCIARSSVGKAQVGQLLSGGTTSFDTLIAVLDALKRDCRLFQEPL